MTLEEHIEVDGRRFDEINESIRLIRENHLVHLTDDIADVKKDVGVLNVSLEGVKGDLQWLKQFFWLLATGVAGTLIVSIMSLILKR